MGYLKIEQLQLLYIKNLYSRYKCSNFKDKVKIVTLKGLYINKPYMGLIK